MKWAVVGWKMLKWAVTLTTGGLVWSNSFDDRVKKMNIVWAVLRSGCWAKTKLNCLDRGRSILHICIHPSSYGGTNSMRLT